MEKDSNDYVPYKNGIVVVVVVVVKKQALFSNKNQWSSKGCASRETVLNLNTDVMAQKVIRGQRQLK